MRSLESIDGNSDTYLKNVADHEISFDNIYCVQIRDAIVTGADIIFLDHRPVFFNEVHPFYSYRLYPPPARKRRGDLNNSTKINIFSPLVLITDWKSNTYGHFLLEMLPKIIGFMKLKEQYPNARLLVSSLAGKSAISIIQHFVRKHEMLIYDGETQSISCSCLIVISKLLGDKGFHPAMHSFVSLAKTCANELLHSSNFYRKLYISKARWRQSSFEVDYRKPTNQAELQSYLENQGFHTIYPESLPWADQVALFSYSGIEVIVSEYNSALHNAIFTPSGATIIALNRLNVYQDHIASFAKHRIGYVCDLACASGAKSDPESRYVVDMSKLKRMLGQ